MLLASCPVLGILQALLKPKSCDEIHPTLDARKRKNVAPQKYNGLKLRLQVITLVWEFEHTKYLPKSGSITNLSDAGISQ